MRAADKDFQISRSRGRVAALGEALSHAFRVTLVQTVPRRPLTLSYALSWPSERQRRPTRSPGRPGRFSRRHSGTPGVGKGDQDGQEKRPELRGEPASRGLSAPSTAGPGRCIVHGDQDAIGREHERVCSADSAPACINLCPSTPRESSTASALDEWMNPSSLVPWRWRSDRMGKEPC